MRKMMTVFILMLCIMVPICLMADVTQEELTRRHQIFQDLYFKQNEADFVRLVEKGQVPKTLFIGCSDSRVIPELITLSNPGDLFVVRTAGNFVPPFNEGGKDAGVIGTIEYGVNVLGVHDIVICGHSHCGAIAGLFKPLDGEKFRALKEWLRNGEAAKEMTVNVPEEIRLEQTEKTSVIYQLQHLLTYPFIKEKVEKNELGIHGWYFDIEKGQIFYYDREEFRFKLLK